MNLLEAIILSVIEGITEFLPISSTGHLILASDILGIPQTEFVKSFQIIIQMGAILAVVVLYLPKLFKIQATWKPVLYSFLPAMIVGLLGYKLIKQVLLGNPYVVIATLFVGGILLILIDTISKTENKWYKELSLKQALIIGLFQAISVVPGVSRSAATIVGGLVVGLSRSQAVEFSFLLAVPTMIAATSLDLIETRMNFSGPEIQLLCIGLVTSFLTAMVAVKTFIRYVQEHSFTGFGIYRIFLSLVYWLVFLL